MVVSSIRPTLICLIVVGLFLPLFAAASSQTSDANRVIDIFVICLREPSDQQFCEALLKSLPAGPGADVLTLALQTTDVLRNNATNLVNLTKKLIQETKGNPKDQEFLSSCLHGYTGSGLSPGPYFGCALYFIDQIQQGFKSKDFFAVDYFVIAFEEKNIKYCNVKEVPVPKHLALLQDYGDYIYSVGSVLQALLHFLEIN